MISYEEIHVTGHGQNVSPGTGARAQWCSAGHQVTQQRALLRSQHSGAASSSLEARLRPVPSAACSPCMPSTCALEHASSPARTPIFPFLKGSAHLCPSALSPHWRQCLHPLPFLHPVSPFPHPFLGRQGLGLFLAVAQC